ncbi:hypothetical protein [Dyadobacter sp. NIV53]|uniref:hypothetical protein n=1 Tax=Dyadobacter sp. NIV53 TaxID=2861765 RepID=UPI001C872E53|nr:hypothetical protein [Dyadobacter sp. NIV53]
MENNSMPENGAVVRFMRKDDQEWIQGEYDEQNGMFIEIYSSELVMHNSSDILKWENWEE